MLVKWRAATFVVFSEWGDVYPRKKNIPDAINFLGILVLVVKSRFFKSDKQGIPINHIIFV